MAKLYIMCGLAFSGKSTLSKQIAERFNIIRIAFDELWLEKDKEQPVPKNAEGWKYIRDVAQQKILEVLNNGKSVVYDDNNPKREHREELRNIAKKAGVETTTIYMDTPLQVVRERAMKNRTSQNRHGVEPENFDKVLSDLEVPKSDEHALFFTSETNLKEFFHSLNI